VDPNSNAHIFTCQSPGQQCGVWSAMTCNGRADCPPSQICCAVGPDLNMASQFQISCLPPDQCVKQPIDRTNKLQVCDPSLSPTECSTGTCTAKGPEAGAPLPSPTFSVCI
jgi:hypothetical protein